MNYFDMLLSYALATFNEKEAKKKAKEKRKKIAGRHRDGTPGLKRRPQNRRWI